MAANTTYARRWWALQLGIKTEARAVYTAEKPWQSIIRVADDLGAGLIALGSRGFDGLRLLVLGSVSHKLAHHAHQPVIAVPTPDAVAARREQKSGTKEHTHTQLSRATQPWPADTKGRS